MNEYVVWMFDPHGYNVGFVIAGEYNVVYQTGQRLAASLGYTLNWIQDKSQCTLF